MKTIAALLICIQLIVGCASTQTRNEVEIGKVNELIKRGDRIRVVKTDGTSLDFFVYEIKQDGILGSENVFVSKQEISRIEKPSGSSFDPGAADYAKAALVIVILPFMLLCSVLTNDSRSSGSCGWGH